MRRLAIALAMLMISTAPAGARDAGGRSSCPVDIPRAGFTDVYPLSPHAFDIDCITWRSITDRVDVFGPTEALPRWEMADWLDSTLGWVQDRYGSAPLTFTDTDGVAAAESIEALRKLDVTRGIGGDRFDPFGAVPRWQMALFLTRAYRAAGNDLPSATDHGFTDIGGETPEARMAINQLAALGITTGTGPGTFSPDAPVTREQMASFVARLLEEIWVLQPAVSSCDTASFPIRCTGEIADVSPVTDLRIRIPMFMFDHVGDLDVANARLTAPGTRIDLFLDGDPISVSSSMLRTSGAVYRYWEGVIPEGTRGILMVEAHTWIEGIHSNVRTVSIDLR